MTNFLTSLGSSIGSLAGSFMKGFNETSGIRRPKMLTAGAEVGRWSGGDTSLQDAAARRAMLNSWCYAAITRKAMDLSSGRLSVFHNPDGFGDSGTEIPGHTLIKLMKKPNPFMGRSFFWQYTHQWLDLLGNSYWFLLPDESGRWIREIWPLPANSVVPWPSTDPDEFIDYYVYTVNGREFQIDDNYICHFRYPNPFDMYRGLSPLMAAMLSIDADTAMARWNGQFFGQDNVMPSAIISLSSGDPKHPLDPADVQKVQDALSDEYTASARKSIVTNAYTMTAQLLGWNARDMDFNLGRQFSKEEIFQIFGVFPGMMDKNATEANAEAARSSYNDLTMWPLMGLYSESLDAQILSRFYHPDQESRWQDIRFGNRQQNLSESSGTAHVMTVNERRQRFWKLPPRDGGDKTELEMQGRSVPPPRMVEIGEPSTKSMDDDLLSELRRALDFVEQET